MIRKIIICVLCAVCMSLQAQTIQNNSKWWDGSVLYTASVQGNTVKMKGVGEHEGGFFFELTKLEGKSGEYVLTGNDEQAEALRAKTGWRVQYIRQDGMYFLAVRHPNGNAVWQMTLTPDDLKSCLAFEHYMEKQPVSEQLSSCLLNTTYLANFSKDELRIMRNEILSRHGWKFQSRDLQDYFGRQSWYVAGTDNDAIKLSVIESLNMQLIKSEETVPDEVRGYRSFDGPEYTTELRALVDGDEGQFPGGLDDDGRGPEEIDGEMTYTVTTEKEFLKALGSNRTILIAKNVHLNLSRVLENEKLFTHVAGRRWASDASAFIGQGPLIVSESETDGRQLALVNMKELVIMGAGNSSIEVDPRYAYCLYFINCDNCTVQNLTIGHTEYGYCSGGVIGVTNGRQNMVQNCDLYGCGTYGFDLRDTQDFQAASTTVHDCTYGIMQVWRSTAVRFISCDFFNNKEFELIESRGSMGLSFTDCRFFANNANSMLFSFDTEVFMSGCEIYHPTEKLGTTNMIEMRDMKLSPNPFDTNIKKKSIGPDL